MDLAERTIIPLCSGVHVVLEDAADEILLQARDSQRNDRVQDGSLTPRQYELRLRREVYIGNGEVAHVGDVDWFAPDSAVRRGFFGRAANHWSPHLNSTYKTAFPVRGRERHASMWDLRIDCGKIFPVKISHR